jgi:hypothetical protein
MRRYLLIALVLLVVAFAAVGCSGAPAHVTSAAGGAPALATVHPPCPTGQVLVGDGYAPGVCHDFDTLAPAEKQAAGNYPCPVDRTVSIVNIGTGWATRCLSTEGTP